MYLLSLLASFHTGNKTAIAAVLLFTYIRK